MSRTNSEVFVSVNFEVDNSSKASVTLVNDSLNCCMGAVSLDFGGDITAEVSDFCLLLDYSILSSSSFPYDDDVSSCNTKYGFVDVSFDGISLLDIGMYGM